MNEKDYASIEWSKKLGHLFPDSYRSYYIDVSEGHKVYFDYTRNKAKYDEVCFNIYPAISISMALDLLNENGISIEIILFSDAFPCVHCPQTTRSFTDRHSFQNALCKMIEYLITEGLLEVTK